MKPSDIVMDMGNPVAYYPGLRKYLGSVNAVIFFCQFFYWKGKEASELGTHKSTEEIEAETGLSYEEQLNARKQLKKLGVLIETPKKLEHKIYYRIDVDKLDQIMTQVIDISPHGQNPTRDMGKTQSANKEKPNPRGGESRVRGEGKTQSDPTEITTKNTTEIKTSSSGHSDECPDQQPNDDFLAKHPEAVVFSAKKRQWGSQEDLTCAEWIWGKIIRMYEQAAETDGEIAKPKDPNWTAWANEVRLMCTLDGRTHRQVCELFGRANRDPFWCRNVLSPAKLREKWDDLTLRLCGSGGAAGGRKELDWDGTEWADKLYDEGILR